MRKLFGVAVVAFFLTPATALAGVRLTVTTTADNITAADGQCTLREAIDAASTGTGTPTADCPTNGSPSENQIGFAAALGANPVITLDPAQPPLEPDLNDLTITGPATVNGATNSGVRVIDSGGINLTLTSLTISNGSDNTGVGGGIRLNGPAGSLHLNNSTVSGNKTTMTSATNASATGGGIYSNRKVTLNNSTVTNNQAIATYTGALTGGAISLGGGVEVSGNDVTMENSVASGNQAIASGNGSGSVEADGGGVRNDGAVLIEHSTISGNLASATATATGPPTVQGAGLLFHGGQPIDIELSTITNNLMKAPASTVAGQQLGGGINDSSTDTAEYVSDTIAGNGLDPASQTVGSFFGLNFYYGVGGATENFSNTILANPVGASGGRNCGNGPYSDGGMPNVEFPVYMPDPCFLPADMNVLRADPQLGALGNNGGATPTMVPAPTSPVIDQGAATDQIDLTQDQRGLTRPVVFPGLIHPFDGSDIGAVEVQQACPGFVQATPTTACPSGGGGGGSTPPPTTTPATGQRAAALKKCKKKKSKQKRKKCKKKANKLPI